MEMQQTHYYTTGTATLPWKCNMVHRSCYQGKPNMSQYSASVEDKATVACFFDTQHTTAEKTSNRYPFVYFLSLSLAQSGSAYPINSTFLPIAQADIDSILHVC
jgi:hypothetical protein